MSTVAASAGAALKSTLNPNAPLFIPMAFRQVEDFSPEWWELVKTTTWFREHWFHRHQDQETFAADDDEDVANLLPDSIDLGIGDELSSLDTELAGAAFHHQSMEASDPISMALKQERNNYGFLNNAVPVASLPRNDFRPIMEAAKYQEKLAQRVSPKYSHRHVIQQPR